VVTGGRALEALVSKKTVLLVDDSAAIRDVVKIYLMGLPFEYLEADSAERGLSVLGVMPVDLVIADVKLPGMNGIDFVKRVRAHDLPHVRKVPLVLLTGQTGDAIRSEGVAAGADAVLNKPINSRAILPLVQRLLPDLPPPVEE
jgi:two-component system chemotaxis response regulator CheY